MFNISCIGVTLQKVRKVSVFLVESRFLIYNPGKKVSPTAHEMASVHDLYRETLGTDCEKFKRVCIVHSYLCNDEIDKPKFYGSELSNNEFL